MDTATVMAMDTATGMVIMAMATAITRKILVRAQASGKFLRERKVD